MVFNPVADLRSSTSAFAELADPNRPSYWQDQLALERASHAEKTRESDELEAYRRRRRRRRRRKEEEEA